MGYVVGLGGGSAQVGGGIGLGVGVLITLLMMRRVDVKAKSGDTGIRVTARSVVDRFS